MSKISIVGVGAVGAASAFTLSQEAWVNELVLIDINQEKAQGEALDIMHGMPLSQNIEVISGDYADSKDSDIVVITVGVPEVVGESRLIPLQKNTEILEGIIPEILHYSPDAILVLVTNPVDLLTYVSYRVAGIESGRVIGLGTMLDTSRLRYLLARDFNVSADNVQAFVVGEHGDSQVVLWSKTTIAGLSVEEYAAINKIPLAEDYFQAIEEEVRKTAFDVWEMKGPNAYCVALAIADVSKAIIRDENRILPVSSYSQLENTHEDIYISLPSVINREGIVKTLDMPMNTLEKERFESSKKLLKELADQIQYRGED